MRAGAESESESESTATCQTGRPGIATLVDVGGIAVASMEHFEGQNWPSHRIGLELVAGCPAVLDVRPSRMANHSRISPGVEALEEQQHGVTRREEEAQGALLKVREEQEVRGELGDGEHPP